MTFDQLPKSLIYPILDKVNLADLYEIGKTNPKIANIIKSSNFWSYKLRNFPNILAIQPENMTLFEWYKLLHENKVLILSKNPKLKLYYVLELAGKTGYINLLKLINDLNTVNLRHTLNLAAKHGHLDIIKYIIDAGFNIATDDRPINLAYRAGHYDIVKYLAQQGSSLLEVKLAAKSNEEMLRFFKSISDQFNYLHNSTLI